MGLMKDGQSIPDPRLRYYFYRQVFLPDPTTDEGLLECGLQNPKPTHWLERERERSFQGRLLGKRSWR